MNKHKSIFPLNYFGGINIEDLNYFGGINIEDPIRWIGSNSVYPNQNAPSRQLMLSPPVSASKLVATLVI